MAIGQVEPPAADRETNHGVMPAANRPLRKRSLGRTQRRPAVVCGTPRFCVRTMQVNCHQSGDGCSDLGPRRLPDKRGRVYDARQCLRREVAELTPALPMRVPPGDEGRGWVGFGYWLQSVTVAPPGVAVGVNPGALGVACAQIRPGVSLERVASAVTCGDTRAVRS